MEKTVLCQRACGKFCRGLAAAFVRVRDWKGLRVRRTFWDWGRGTLETSMNLPLLGHWYRTWSREELKWDIVFARLFFPGLLTAIPLYRNHGSTPTCASFEARTCMLAESCTDLWSIRKGHCSSQILWMLIQISKLEVRMKNTLVFLLAFHLFGHLWTLAWFQVKVIILPFQVQLYKCCPLAR